MIKAKFGQRLRSRTLTAHINEALCKVLCHNLCVVIQSVHELGIETNFADSAKQTIWVSVKGTQGYAWGLMARYKKDRGYHEAIDAWATANHSSQIIYCLVSLQGINLGECPRVYLATVAEISKRLKESRNGAGHTILWENRCYTKGIAKGCTDMLPTEWSFSHDRLAYIFETFGAETVFASKPRSD